MDSLTIIQGYADTDIDRLYELEKVSFSRAFRWLKGDLIAALQNCDVIQGVYDNKMAGYVLGELEGDAGHIISLTVDPAYRRMGFGSALLEATEAFYKKQGVKKIKLEVHIDNPAQILYFKAGYRVSGFKPRYYSNGNPAIAMVKPLKK